MKFYGGKNVVEVRSRKTGRFK